MQVTDYSFLMATVASSIMIVAIYFLRKTRLFADTFGVNFMLLLYALSFVRMFVPVEIPAVQTVINDRYILAPIMDVLENRAGFTESWNIPATYILGGVLSTVSLVLLAVLFIRQCGFISYIKKQKNLATPAEMEKLNNVAKTVFGNDKKLTLIKCDAVGTPMVTGMLSSVVLLPDYAYTDSELDMVFLHECTHIKNKDLLLKFLVHVYCCLFWWNPFVYLLRADMDFILELKCDNNACASLGELRKLDYIQAINNCARNAVVSKKKTPVLVASGFATMDGTQRHTYRLNNLLSPVYRTWKARLMTVVASLVMVLICVLSFLFIWQPAYPLTQETHPEIYASLPEGAIMADETNSYLVQQDDGSYVFYFDGREFPVSKEEYDAGGYQLYPIYDNPQ